MFSRGGVDSLGEWIVTYPNPHAQEIKTGGLQVQGQTRP